LSDVTFELPEQTEAEVELPATWPDALMAKPKLNPNPGTTPRSTKVPVFQRNA